MKKLSAKKLWAIAGVLAFIGWMIPETPQAKAARQQADQARADRQQLVDAWIASHRLIEQRLKAPGTASWSPFQDSQVSRGADGTVMVVGWVDSQNSFGAKVRTNYSALVKREADTWRLVSLSTR